MNVSLTLDLNKTTVVRNIEKIRFSGQLTVDGSPVKYAKIELWFDPPHEDAFMWGYLVTDSDGKYSVEMTIEDPKHDDQSEVVGLWEVQTAWRGYSGDEGPYNSPQRVFTVTDLDVNLSIYIEPSGTIEQHIQTARIYGSLKSGSTPIPDAVIELWLDLIGDGKDPFMWGTAITDADGNYEFRLAFNEVGEWHTNVTWRGPRGDERFNSNTLVFNVVPPQIQIKIWSDTDIVEEGKGFTLYGSVTHNGDPIPGIKIEIWRYEVPQEPGTWWFPPLYLIGLITEYFRQPELYTTVMTDEEGKFTVSMSFPHDGPWKLQAAWRGFDGDEEFQSNELVVKVWDWDSLTPWILVGAGVAVLGIGVIAYQEYRQERLIEAMLLARR